MLTIDPRMVNMFWAHSSIIYKHMSFFLMYTMRSKLTHTNSNVHLDVSISRIMHKILDNFNCQYHVRLNTKLHKYGGWWTWNINIWSCGRCVAILLFLMMSSDVFVSISARPSLFSKNWFSQIYLNVNYTCPNYCYARFRQRLPYEMFL